jgi:hypothetical protein
MQPASEQDQFSLYAASSSCTRENLTTAESEAVTSLSYGADQVLLLGDELSVWLFLCI